MPNYNLILLGFFYILGLSLSSILGFPTFEPSVNKWLIIISIIISLTLIGAFVISQRWRLLPRLKVWLLGGLIAILAVIYFQGRVPHPQPTDVSQILIKDNLASELVTVKGKILEQPQVNAKNKIRFIIAVNQLQKPENKQQKLWQDITGKTYVTLPLLQGNGLYVGQKIEITGILYLPKNAVNPGAFDFQYYLAQRGVFSGITGFKSEINLQEKEPFFNLNKLRKRIIQAQVKALGSPDGQLLSSIVLGRSAVDLPYQIKDLFMQSGLAHILAASGFQIALLLGVVLKLTQRFSSKNRLIISIIVLSFYILLTGAEASVCRAGLMGLATLLGLLTERQVNALGSLFVAGILLLIINPLWMWDLGFQLSFLATLGLIISANQIEQKLDFLFPVIANPLAVTLAANLWVFPLTIFTFKTFPVYSIFVNLITTPFVIIISLGGMISGFLALINPVVGTFGAQLLFYPIHFLIKIIEFFHNLPYRNWAVGQIPLGLMLLIYGIFILTYFNQWLNQRLFLVVIFILTLIIVPIWYKNHSLLQVTIFQTKQPSIMIQNQGEHILITEANADNLVYTILPFLKQEGINKINTLVNLSPQFSWQNYDLMIEKNLNLNQDQVITSLPLTLDFFKEKMLKLTVNQETWLLLFEADANLIFNEPVQVLVWWGKEINLQLLEKLKPHRAIAVTSELNQSIQNYLIKQQTKLYITQQDGAIQWQEKTGFQSLIN